MHQARENRLARGPLPIGVRRMVADSWLRSAAAGVDADSSPPPITLTAGLLADYRAEHPLAEIFPLLYDVAAIPRWSRPVTPVILTALSPGGSTGGI